MAPYLQRNASLSQAEIDSLCDVSYLIFIKQNYNFQIEQQITMDIRFDGKRALVTGAGKGNLRHDT